MQLGQFVPIAYRVLSLSAEATARIRWHFTLVPITEKGTNPHNSLPFHPPPPDGDSNEQNSPQEHSPETGKVQTVIWRCTCMFWRESASHSGHWEAHLRNPKSK